MVRRSEVHAGLFAGNEEASTDDICIEYLEDLA